MRVVITLRADFYHRPLQYPQFGELVRRQMETVLPLSASELERVIVGPAERIGMRFEEGLVPTIFEDVHYQPGALPLMQYALTELFDRREEQLLTCNAYDALGGTMGALTGRAESLFQELDAEGQETTRQLFLRLTTIERSGDSGQMVPVTRRRVTRSELRAVAGDSELMDEIVDIFTAYRLLSLDHDPATRRPTVEAAHEAILVSWARLNSWLEESRDDVRLRRRLAIAAADWLQAGQDKGFLLRGSRLDLFTGWAANMDLALTHDEHAFLAASTTARLEREAEDEVRLQRELETAQQLAETESARAQTEQIRAEEQTQASRRLRWLAVGLAALLLAAISFAFLAAQQAHRADEQARLAQSRELAALALGNIAVDPERSILLALEAAEENIAVDGKLLSEMEEVLHRAIQASRVLLTLPQGGGLSFSPDGTRLATSGEEGEITIWNVATGEALGILSGHSMPVGDIAFSPDGKLLASVSEDFSRIIWDLNAGQPLLELPAAAGIQPIIISPDIEFSPNGDYLLTTAFGEETRLFEVTDGREVISFSDLKHAQGIAFSPDGDRVAIGNTGIFALPANLQDKSADNVIQFKNRLTIFEGAESALTAGERRIYDAPTGISFAPDGNRVAAASTDRQAKIWDAATGELLLTLDGHTGLVHDIAYSPDGRQLATASADGTTKIWDAQSGQERLTLTGHHDEVLRVAFGPNGQTVASSSLDGTTKLWDISQGGEQEWFSLFGHEGDARLAVDPTGQKVATAGVDGIAKVWDAQSGAHLFSLNAEDTPFTAIAFSPDGQLIALGRKDAHVDLFFTETGELFDSIEGRREITSLAFTPAGSSLAIGNLDGTVLLWNLETDDIATWRILSNAVMSLDFSQIDERLATAGSTVAAVWDFEDLIDSQNEYSPAPPQVSTAKLYDIRDHADAVSSIRFKRDGSQLLTASWDSSAIIWDAASGEALNQLHGHTGRVAGADFSPDGNLIATAGFDGKTILWDTKTGEKKFVLGERGEPLHDVVFTPDGKHLLTSDYSGVVHAYVVPTEDLLALARERVTRTLTDQECQLFLHTNSARADHSHSLMFIRQQICRNYNRFITKRSP